MDMDSAFFVNQCFPVPELPDNFLQIRYVIVGKDWADNLTFVNVIRRLNSSPHYLLCGNAGIVGCFPFPAFSVFRPIGFVVGSDVVALCPEMSGNHRCCLFPRNACHLYLNPESLCSHIFLRLLCFLRFLLVVY